MPKTTRNRKAVSERSTPMAKKPSIKQQKQEELANERLTRKIEREIASRHSIPNDLCRVVGTDEAGRGALFGPLVVASCSLPDVGMLSETERIWFGQIRDSKKLSDRVREQLYEKLIAHPDVVHAVDFISHETIDRLNVKCATLGGMTSTANHVVSKLGALPQNKNAKMLIIVDGNLMPNGLESRSDLIAECLPKADDLCLSVGAASILAKVARDRKITELSKSPQYAMYGLANNAGYGTEAHFDALKKHGYTDLHRMSFAPMKHMKIQDSDNSPDVKTQTV